MSMRMIECLCLSVISAAILPLLACDSSELATDAEPSSTPDAAAACESPLNPVPPGAQPTGQGCDCTSGWTQPDYCINGWGLFCAAGSGNRWRFLLDGRCFPTEQHAELVQTCRERKGVLSAAPDRSCPTGFGRLSSAFVKTDGGAPPREYCCDPIEVTSQACTQAGLSILATGTQSSLLDTTCSNGGQLRGFVTDAAGPSLCCAGSP